MRQHFHACRCGHPVPFVFAFLAFLLLLCAASPSSAQTQQPFLFAPESLNSQATGVAVFVRNDQTGELTEVANSPFTAIHSQSCSMEIVDPKGRFAYGACGLGAAMYTIDETTGAVAEVSGSPFGASTDPTLPYIAAESTGQYVYALKTNFSTTYPINSTVLLDTFQVDSAGNQLIALSSQQIVLDGTLVALAASSHGFYLFLNQDQGTDFPLAVLYGILFDPVSGQASAPQQLVTASNNARAMMFDPVTNMLVLSSGQQCGSLWFLQLSKTDGTVSTSTSVGIDPCLVFAGFSAFDPTGNFLYLQFSGEDVTETGTRIFSTSTGLETTSSPLPASLESEIGGLPDPQGPFGYFSGPSPSLGISVYTVDPTTGYPVLPTGFTNPLFPGRDLGPALATIDVNTEPVQVPAASLSATSLSFGPVTVGQTTNSQSVILTDIGGLALSLTSIQLTGTNAADFAESDNCMSPPQLQPNKSCTITVSYSPAAAGSSSAAILITDNATGSPQQISLSGVAVAPPPPAPAVTLIPGTLNIPTPPATITQGTSSTPQPITVTNSGNASLQITGTSMSGVNNSDFSVSSNTCSGSFAANASCTISIIFSPLASGVRTTTLTITDNAPNSPQSVTIDGYASPAVSIATPTGGSTTASLSAGQTAQYNLQATPGAGFNGTLSFTCSGAPIGATCSVPSNVAVTNGTAANFTITVTTSGSAAFVPPDLPTPCRPLPGPGLFSTILAAVLSVLLLGRFHRLQPQFQHRSLRAAALALLLFILGLGGCGGGSSSAPPASVVTPSGTYYLVVTPTATPSGSTKQLPLNPIQLTLIVK
jgi:hypothetical protein